MKYSRLFCLSVILTSALASAAVADNTKSNVVIEGKLIDQMTKEDFRNYYLKHHSRKPIVSESSKAHGENSANVDNNNEKGLQKRAADLPSKMVFPGEFEEVRAIQITWPYLVDPQHSFASSGDIDLEDSSELPVIFSNLAKAIDDNAEVWINIQKAQDSTKIINYMSKKDMPLKHARFFVNPVNSFWYRDCGPVTFYYGDQDSIGFVDFKYYDGREDDDVIAEKIGKKMGFPVFKTSLNYEGGNIIMDGQRTLFTSNEIYNNNSSWTQAKVRDTLKKYLNLKDMLILPKLKYDGGTGHIDLYADLWDENNFVFSGMPKEMDQLTDYPIVNKNINTIMAFFTSEGKKYRKVMIPFPRRDDGKWYTSDDDYTQYTYTYSNHAFVNKTIIQPVFGSETKDYIKKDIDSLKAKYPGYNIVPINMEAFKGYGGAVHCLTKEIPADNPLRITHVPVNVDTSYSNAYLLKATIYNKSGIAGAVCKWRYKGSTVWDSTTLTSVNASVFTGEISNNKSNTTVEYYLQVTSKNGKTMTKPIVAPAGFYSFHIKGSTFCLNSALDKKNTVELFQMQSAGKLYLKTFEFDSDLEFKLFTVAGKSVYTQKINCAGGNKLFEINTSSINSGSFLAVLKSKNAVVYKDKLTIIK